MGGEAQREREKDEQRSPSRPRVTCAALTWSWVQGLYPGNGWKEEKLMKQP